jgi:hypothetical protein
MEALLELFSSPGSEPFLSRSDPGSRRPLARAALRTERPRRWMSYLFTDQSSYALGRFFFQGISGQPPEKLLPRARFLPRSETCLSTSGFGDGDPELGQPFYQPRHRNDRQSCRLR